MPIQSTIESRQYGLYPSALLPWRDLGTLSIHRKLVWSLVCLVSAFDWRCQLGKSWFCWTWCWCWSWCWCWCCCWCWFVDDENDVNTDTDAGADVDFNVDVVVDVNDVIVISFSCWPPSYRIYPSILMTFIQTEGKLSHCWYCSRQLWSQLQEVRLHQTITSIERQCPCN